MRLTLAIVLSGFLLATSCDSARQSGSDLNPPKVGKVLAANDGTGQVVISLGSSDGIRPGDSLVVLRAGNQVGEVIIHEARGTQATGTAVGGSGAGDIAPGDAVIGK